VIWLAWRQFRTPALVVGGALVVLGVLLALNGSHLVHLYDTSVATCAQHGDCPSVTQNFESQAKWNHVLSALVLVAPALVGAFWGAPLVARELENRTNRLAWTQSVTRGRWFTVKLAMVGVASVAAVALLALMVTWWASPYDRLHHVPYTVFDQRDIVPVAYALFAAALGVAAGVIIRRTLPAMAVTIVAFVAVRVVVGQWVRPLLMAPVRLLTQFTLPSGTGPEVVMPGTGSIDPASWIISEQVLNHAGRVIGQNGGIGPNGDINFGPGPNGATILDGVGRCPNPFPSPPGGGQRTVQVNSSAAEAARRCVASFHLRSLVTFQPTGRYWTLQWYEAAIFVGAAVILAGLSFWWIRHRTS